MMEQCLIGLGKCDICGQMRSWGKMVEGKELKCLCENPTEQHLNDIISDLRKALKVVKKERDKWFSKYLEAKGG